MNTFELSKKLGLTPPTAQKEKPLYYRGLESEGKLVSCSLVELVSNHPMVVRIMVNGIECDIALDYLKEMQPTKEDAIQNLSRPHKGNSLLDAISTYTVIDIETTGIDPRADDIIELAAIKVVGGVVKSVWDKLINPELPIPKKVARITGITDEMVSDAPTISEVISEFIDFVGNDVVVGHNVNFDINFIYDRCEYLLNCPFSNDYIDTLRLSRKLLKSLEHHHLCDVAEALNVQQEGYHRAAADCYTTHMCYQEMIKRFGGKEKC